MREVQRGSPVTICGYARDIPHISVFTQELRRLARCFAPRTEFREKKKNEEFSRKFFQCKSPLTVTHRGNLEIYIRIREVKLAMLLQKYCLTKCNGNDLNCKI